MGWLYVPGLAASNWDANSPCPDIEPSVTWRGKPIARRSFRRAWKTAPWLRRLSGMTLEPSTAGRGVESWISSLRATRASRSASPAAEAGRMISGTCGRTSLGLFGSVLHPSLFAKTYPGTFRSDSALCAASWMRWGMALRRGFIRRERLARHTGGLDSFSWPTLMARDFGESGYEPAAQARTSPNLAAAVRLAGDDSPGKLNPEWCEWLMGFPAGWTAFEPLETEWSRWRREMQSLI